MAAKSDPPNGSGDVVTSTSKPLSKFTRLSKVVRLYEPPPSSSTTTTTTSPTSPTTILLCSWLNAHPKHVQYYTNSYSRLYPHARIILVAINTQQFLLESESTRRIEVQEAVAALLARPQTEERLLVHSLSNGGARRVYNISAAYRAATGRPLPLRAFIVDSAPGIPQFRRDIHALSLPGANMSLFVWVPYMTAVVLITTVVYIVVNWMPKWVWGELVWRPMEALNNSEYLDKDCVKGFVYSKEDLAIDWKNVEDHAATAEENGYRVVKKRIEGAEHVQMFKGKGGEQDYWGFVKRIWDMANDAKRP